MAALLLLLLAGCARRGPQAAPPADLALTHAPTTPAARELSRRAEEVARVLAACAREVGALPAQATPEQLAFQRSKIIERVRAARAPARPGDLFTPEAAAEIRATAREVLGGLDGAADRQALTQGQPGSASKLTLNAPYPVGVPLPTMPAHLLARLPPLPAALEYRILGDTLIVRARDAGVVIDILPRAIPAPAPANPR